MPSAAKTAFSHALNDVDNLLWFHAKEGGDGKGKRGAHFESLNKSAVVLLCAAWETYLETVIVECVERNVDAAASPTSMLHSLQKITQSHIRDGKEENAWVSVAGDGWRQLTKSLVKNRVAALNTPKPGPVKELAKAVLGIKDITDNWEWHRNELGVPSNNLQAFVTLRGSIAHGERLTKTVTKAKVKNGYELVSRLVNCVEEKLINEGFLAI
ncbi:HEPN domain-containing protein [Magnetospirillum sp. 64-120]|uniref:HEPN domain-containing protein n=1 Tax=Magnetospirillum sp. 64-120 TaxID=1895778 RepID=UPI0025C5D377|nr:HEPN domain-containing protein [Magnetospirillum sp. 64-120]